jgi:hypothetical protein
MNRKFSWLLSLLCFGLFAVPTFAQCNDQHDRPCWSLQYILYAAETDFREFVPSKPLKSSDPKTATPNPDLTVGASHVPCHMDYWANYVAVYMCSSEMPVQEAEEWYAKTMENLHELQYLWQFRVSTGEPADAAQYVDAGPPGCDIPDVETIKYGTYHIEGPFIKEGPYLGQCPLHLQTVQLGDGRAKVSFWLNSYTSANLARNPGPSKNALPSHADSQVLRAASSTPTNVDSPAPESADAMAPAGSAASVAEASTQPVAKKSTEPTAAARGGCDDLCQGLKKILEHRRSAFRGIGAGINSGSRDTRSVTAGATAVSPGNGSPASAAVDALLKLSGAASCLIKSAPMADSLSSAKNAAASRPRVAAVSTDAALISSAAADPSTPQYVCYWPQKSEGTAESQFFDLVGLLQVLIPSTWSSEQRVEADELSGAQITVWAARDASNRAAIGLYLSGKSVGLHISSGD